MGIIIPFCYFYHHLTSLLCDKAFSDVSMAAILTNGRQFEFLSYQSIKFDQGRIGINYPNFVSCTCITICMIVLCCKGFFSYVSMAVILKNDRHFEILSYQSIKFDQTQLELTISILILVSPFVRFCCVIKPFL